MKPLEYFGVSGQQVTQQPTHVLKIEGQFLAASAARWLQVHDSATVPAEGAVPLKQWPLDPSSQFFQTFAAGELAVAEGLYICISTSDGTKTLSADTMDLGVELTDAEQPSGLTQVGDEANDRGTLQVWADGAGPKKLYRLKFKNTAGRDIYIFLYRYGADAAPSFLGKVLNGATREWFFGQGLAPETLPGANGHNGCIIEGWNEATRATTNIHNGAFLAFYK